MISLKKIFNNYHSVNSPVVELVPWFELLTDQLILNSDGSLMAGFEIDGLDKSSCSKEEFNTATKHFENATKLLNERNTLWSYFDKRKIEIKVQSQIANPIANFLEVEWLSHLSGKKLSAYKIFLYISYTASNSESISLKKFTNLYAKITENFKFITSKINALNDEEVFVEKIIFDFENQLESFAKILSSIKIRRLGKIELLSQLSNRINLTSCKTNIKLPENINNKLSHFLVADSIQRVDDGVLKFIGSTENRYVSMLTIKGYPGILENTDVEKLLNVEGEFTVIQTFKFLSKEESKNLLMKKEQYYRSKIKSPLVQMFEKISGSESTRMDLGQLSYANDARDALISMSEVENNFGFHTMSILVLGENINDLNRTRRSISEVLNNVGFSVIKEVIHQIGAFMTSIPGAIDVVVRSSLVSLSNLAHLVIFRSVDPGFKKNKFLTEQMGHRVNYLCLFPTQSGVPEYFNFHVGDVGHFLLVGQSGSGKTTFVNFTIAMWQKYFPSKTIIFDKDNSCYLTVKALGGEYIRLSKQPNLQLKMNPLQWLKNPEKIPAVTSWLLGLFSSFNQPQLSPNQIETLNQSLKMLLASIKGNITLSHLKLMIDGLDKNLGSRLSPWINEENSGVGFGYLFDNQIDTFYENFSANKNGLICIDIGSILDDINIFQPIIEYLLFCIDVFIDGKTPSFIYLEEAWYLLKDRRFSKEFENWIRTMRKKMAIVGLSTQSVDDLKKIEISSIINDNIKTKIFLPNLLADSSYGIYKDFFGLSDDQIQLIKQMVPKKNYLVWQDSRVRVINAEFPFNVLSFISSDKLSIKTFEKSFFLNGNSGYLKLLKDMN